MSGTVCRVPSIRLPSVGLGYTSSNLTVVPKGKLYGTDWNNFAPRVGFAFDPKGDGKTAIRGNWGMFYDRTVGAAFNSIDGGTPGFCLEQPDLSESAGFGRPLQRQVLTYPAQPAAPLLTPPATRSTALYLANPNLRTGYVMSYGLNVQHEIMRNTILQVGYIGNRGVKLFMDVDVNQPRIYGAFQNDFRELAANLTTPANVSPGNLFVKVFGTAASAITAVGSTNISQGRVGTIVNTIDVTNYAKYNAAGISNYYFRNYPQFTQVVQGTNNGRSSYDSLQVSLRRTAGALQFAANYTWSKSIDNISAEGNGFTTPIDSYNLALNRRSQRFRSPAFLEHQRVLHHSVRQRSAFGSNMPRLLDTAVGRLAGGRSADCSVRAAFLGEFAARDNGGERRGEHLRQLHGNGPYHRQRDPPGRRRLLLHSGSGGAVRLSRTRSRSATRAATFSATRLSIETDASLVKKFRITEGAVGAVPRGSLQPVQSPELRVCRGQPEHQHAGDVREVQPDHRNADQFRFFPDAAACHALRLLVAESSRSRPAGKSPSGPFFI